MLPIDSEWASQWAMLLMLTSVRLFGFFLLMPLFAFRAMPMRLRLLLALLMSWGLMPTLELQAPPLLQQAGYAWLALELGIGLACGLFVRIGFLAIELFAEILSIQSGLSFASSTFRDPLLSSGVTGELTGLLTLALAFLMNVHLLVLDLVVQSFRTLPLATWPAAWNLAAVVELLQVSFTLGVVLSLPAVVVYLLFNLSQGVMARVSPQLNLFSIGFAIMVPVAFVVMALIFPAMPELVQRALEAPLDLLRLGLLSRPGG
jgi:flagellar biosynthetic protein FliR